MKKILLLLLILVLISCSENTQESTTETEIDTTVEKPQEIAETIEIDNTLLINDEQLKELLVVLESLQGQKEISQIQRLLETKNINETGWRDSSSLILACREGYVDLVKILVKHGADIEAVDGIDYSALMWASYNGRTEILQFLIESGADTSAMTIREWASAGIKEKVLTLIGSGADVNESTSYGTTALMRASANGFTEIVQILIENGAIVNARTDEGGTALNEATYGGYREIVRILLNNGARNSDAILNAVLSGDLEIVKMLVESGTDIDGYTKYTGTSLTLAFDKNHLEIAEYLLKNGADTTIEDDGFTVYNEVAYDNNLEGMKLLIAYGEDVNTKTYNNTTALMSAVYAGNIEMVELLINAGADVTCVASSTGFTALSAAIESDYTEIIALLKAAGATE